MRIPPFPPAALAISILASVSPTVSAVDFVIGLDTAQERPVPIIGAFTPSGSATVTVDTVTGAVGVSGSYAGMTSAVSAAHLHGPATPGFTAGVVVGLTVSGGTSGTIGGGGTLNANQIEDLLEGNLYLNVHTGNNPQGEIRGQVVDPDIQLAEVNLDQFQEIPTPTIGGGLFPTGVARVVLDRSAGRVEISGQYFGMTSNVGASHLHGPASPGATASPIITLANTGGTSGTFSGAATLSSANRTALFEGRTYLNIHTANNGAGEIRGQVPGFRDPAIPFRAVAGLDEIPGLGPVIAITFPSAPFRPYRISETIDFLDPALLDTVPGAADAVETTVNIPISGPLRFFLVTEE